MNDFYSAQLVFLALAFGTNIVFQVVIFRFRSDLTLVISLVLGFFCGISALLVMETAFLMRNGDSAAQILAMTTVSAVILFCLSYGYFQLLNIGEASLRIRILREIDASPDGLTEEQILSKYGAKEIIETRLRRLITTRQVICRDGRYFCGRPKVLYVAKTLRFFKKLVFGSSYVDPLSRSAL